MENFPPPLKEKLPSDAVSPSRQDPGPGPGVALYREIFPCGQYIYPQGRGGGFPWTQYPQGTAIVVIGGDGQVPVPPPVPETLPVEEDNTYHMQQQDLSYLSYILSSWQRAVIALANLYPEIPTFPTHTQ
eukprot:scaffold198394_cov35-Attheya_sp.AAC.1